MFRRYMHQIAKSLIKHGAKRIVFLNTGIFKATELPLAMAAREIRVQDGIPTIVVSWDDLEDKQVEEPVYSAIPRKPQPRKAKRSWQS
ncbi:MAG: creatininase family protein [bacterium]|nr:creatininase family protein [bacterium]